jgi:hypothetical protein
LAVGLGAGVLGGALIAPHLHGSPRRSKVVFASTALGATLGGMLVRVVTKPSNGDSSSGDLVAGCMIAGMWGGFRLGILMTKGAEPDVRFNNPAPGVRRDGCTFAGDRGRVGMMAGGTW